MAASGDSRNPPQPKCTRQGPAPRKLVVAAKRRTDGVRKPHPGGVSDDALHVVHRGLRVRASGTDRPSIAVGSSKPCTPPGPGRGHLLAGPPRTFPADSATFAQLWSPGAGCRRGKIPANRHNALVAQWIEHRFPKPGVAGSIPAGGARSGCIWRVPELSSGRSSELLPNADILPTRLTVTRQHGMAPIGIAGRVSVLAAPPLGLPHGPPMAPAACWPGPGRSQSHAADSSASAGSTMAQATHSRGGGRASCSRGRNRNRNRDWA